MCSECQAIFTQWLGKCSSCGEWNTIVEQGIVAQSSSLLMHTESLDTHTISRFTTTINEFNQVTGGGLVPGSVILIGGEPGIGKSTLLLQLCASMIDKTCRPLYISGEESAQQVSVRAQRLAVNTTLFDAAFGTQADTIIQLLNTLKPKLIIIDSIQTLSSTQADGQAGSPNQIKMCSSILGKWAKDNHACIILVGHITKDGSLAGPKLLEHMVDVVLYFEGERSGSARILKSIKNRYGPTDEVGIFQMNDNGLEEVLDPSKFFLQNNRPLAAGIVTFPALEGTRVILLEIQALIVDSYTQIPKRSVVGWDPNRLYMIAAVIENKLKIRLGQKEIYINVVGGMRIQEPAVDLAVVVALLSAYLKIALPREIAVFGEIGLAGEVRSATRESSRLRELAKFGINRVITCTNIISQSIIPCNTINTCISLLKNL